jgi:hypothetical protein
MEARILKQIRFLKIYAAAMTLAFAALCLTALNSSPANTKFGDIDVNRINIVDHQGKRRLVISNEARFPEPVVEGHELKGARRIKPAGIVFYDAKGNETGGLVTSQTESGRISLMAFDSATAEALDLGIETDDRDKYTAALRILDPSPPGTKLEEATSKQQTRITLQNKNKDASITLADANGKDRIKLGVASNGEAKIQILDEKGKVMFNAPQ